MSLDPSVLPRGAVPPPESREGARMQAGDAEVPTGILRGRM